MAKITKEQYNLFCKECNRLIKKYKITGWEVKYVWGPIDYSEDRVRLKIKDSERLAIFHLNKEWEMLEIVTDTDIKDMAKHQVIHLLLAPLDSIGSLRYLQEKEYHRVVEELVLHLDELIK